MICSLVNKVDSLTEYQPFYPRLTFESQPETAPAYKIAEELLSITGFCLLKSKSWWSLLTFLFWQVKEMKGRKEGWQVFSLKAGDGGEKKNEKKSLYDLTTSQEIFVLFILFLKFSEYITYGIVILIKVACLMF